MSESACKRCGHDPAAVVARSWSFWCDMEIESLNAHRVNAGTRWAQTQYRRRRNAWQQWVVLGMHNQRIPRAVDKRRRVTIVRQYSGRQRPFDEDNAAGGAKPLVDAMVRVGLLVNDTREWCEVSYPQRLDTKSGTWILIEELA